jgi:hypothetical protein
MAAHVLTGKCIATISLLCVGLAFGSAVAKTPQAEGTYYINVRFQYSICYPAAILVPQGESENSDGQKFLAKDGTELIVWGQHNVQEHSIAAEMKDTIASITADAGTVTYKASKADWFVLSGKMGGKVYYQKTMHSALAGNDIFISYRLTYDFANAARYEPLTGQLNECFMPSVIPD